MSDIITPRRARPPRTLAISVLLLVAVVVGAASYASPYFMPRAIRQAALDGDREKLEQLIDFPRVREGLKSDLKVMMGDLMRAEMAKDTNTDNPFAAGLAQLAVGMASSLVDSAVDQAVSPASIERIVLGKPAAPQDAADARSPVGALMPKNASGDGYRIESKYLAFDRFRYIATDEKQHAQFVVDMHRRGLFGWQVTRVTPKLDLAKLGADKPAPPATVAAQEPATQITRLVGGTTLEDAAKPLLEAIANAQDGIIGLQVRIEAGEADGPEAEQLVLSSPEYEVLIPGSAARWEHGGYVVDGFFLVKSGGMHQGVLSYGLEPVDEAQVRLRPNTTVADRRF